MEKFTPGKVVKTFTSKKGNNVVIRYPKWEDLDEMTVYINELSEEDAFITFSGETITKKEEATFLSEMLSGIEFGDKVILVAYIEGKLAGISNVNRNLGNRERKKHIGILGLSVLKEFRSEGLGKELMATVIDEAKKHISGMKIVTLEVYGKNDIARSLYKKMGFVESGILPGGLKYKDEYIDDITMHLSLTQS